MSDLRRIRRITCRRRWGIRAVAFAALLQCGPTAVETPADLSRKTVYVTREPDVWNELVVRLLGPLDRACAAGSAEDCQQLRDLILANPELFRAVQSNPWPSREPI